MRGKIVDRLVRALTSLVLGQIKTSVSRSELLTYFYLPNMNSIDPVELMKRQYLQLSDPDELGFPPQELLRWPGTQAQIYDAMFNESSSMYLPPKRYRFRVLKRIVSLLEQAIQDPEEDVGFCISYWFLLCNPNLVSSPYSSRKFQMIFLLA